MNENLYQAIQTFDPISLEEMDEVKLMDRTDTKFVFHLSKLPYIFNKLADLYRILVVNNIRNSQYKSLYYDTNDLQLYIKHHNGKLNRYKIRYRKYVESDLHFFEIKFKNNKGRTIKTRVKRDEIEYKINGKARKLLIEKTPLNSELLVPTIWINYSRITLVNKFSKERVTIDTNLNFKNEKLEKNMDQLVIAEVKQENVSSSPFMSLMKEEHIREGSISKYCFGIASLFNGVKQNNFKPKILTINKLNSL